MTNTNSSIDFPKLDTIKVGADIHAGDGGYSIGTQQEYDEFVKVRNQSLTNMRIEELMYRAGLTAQGCWDKLDAYDKQAMEKFAHLIVKECADISDASFHNGSAGYLAILKHFGVEP